MSHDVRCHYCKRDVPIDTASRFPTGWMCQDNVECVREFWARVGNPDEPHPLVVLGED